MREMKGPATLRCEILDEGMIHILSYDLFMKINMKSNQEVFELKSLEKVNEKNAKLFYEILNIRDKNVRAKIIHFLTKEHSYLLFGTCCIDEELIQENVYQQTHKDVVLLYTPKIKFLPGVFYLRKNFIKKRAS